MQCWWDLCNQKQEMLTFQVMFQCFTCHAWGLALELWAGGKTGAPPGLWTGDPVVRIPWPDVQPSGHGLIFPLLSPFWGFFATNLCMLDLDKPRPGGTAGSTEAWLSSWLRDRSSGVGTKRCAFFVTAVILQTSGSLAERAGVFSFIF